ncbi:hypothetical protein R6Z07F_000179 [Ovis aries]
MVPVRSWEIPREKEDEKEQKDVERRSPPTRQTETLQIPLGPAHYHRPCPTGPAPPNGPTRPPEAPPPSGPASLFASRLPGLGLCTRRRLRTLAAAEPAAQAGGAEVPGPVAGYAPVSLSRRPSPPRAPAPRSPPRAWDRAAPTAGSAGRGPGAAPAPPCGVAWASRDPSLPGPRPHLRTLITSPPPGSYFDCLHLLSGKVVSQKLTEDLCKCPRGVLLGGARPPVMGKLHSDPSVRRTPSAVCLAKATFVLSALITGCENNSHAC